MKFEELDDDDKAKIKALRDSAMKLYNLDKNAFNAMIKKQNIIRRGAGALLLTIVSIIGLSAAFGNTANNSDNYDDHTNAHALSPQDSLQIQQRTLQLIQNGKYDQDSLNKLVIKPKIITNENDSTMLGGIILTDKKHGNVVDNLSADQISEYVDFPDNPPFKVTDGQLECNYEGCNPKSVEAINQFVSNLPPDATIGQQVIEYFTNGENFEGLSTTEVRAQMVELSTLLTTEGDKAVVYSESDNRQSTEAFKKIYLAVSEFNKEMQENRHANETFLAYLARMNAEGWSNLDSKDVDTDPNSDPLAGLDLDGDIEKEKDETKKVEDETKKVEGEVALTEAKLKAEIAELEKIENRTIEKEKKLKKLKAQLKTLEANQ